MANAIMMERILTSGRFSSAREFSEALHSFLLPFTGQTH